MQRQPLSALIPGLLLTTMLGLLAYLLNSFVPFFGSVSIALILGIIIGNSFRPDERYHTGIRFSETTLLSGAIILMGLKVDMGEIAKFGGPILQLIIPLVIITIVSALLIGKLFKLQSILSLLLGVGNAVCGTSAIAAVAPTTQATKEEVGISIGIVNLIGTIGMLLLPIFAMKIGLEPHESALLIGGSLQAVGQVVAAGNFISEPVGDLATLFKMSRVLMIVPLVIFIPMLMRRVKQEGRTQHKQVLPGYLIGFVICSLFVTLFGADSIAIESLIQLEKILLIIAMAGIGLRIEFKQIITTAPKALLVCTLVTLLQLTLIILYMMI